MLVISSVVRRRGRAKQAIGPDGGPAIESQKVDLTLLNALVRAESWKRRVAAGESFDQVVGAEGVGKTYAYRLARLAFLAPDIKGAILEGRSGEVSLTRLLQQEAPLAWVDQRRGVVMPQERAAPRLRQAYTGRGPG